MKCYRYVEPGFNNEPVYISVTEDSIIETFWDFWCQKMREVGKQDQIARENCIQDFVTIHWAWEIEEK